MWPRFSPRKCVPTLSFEVPLLSQSQHFQKNPNLGFETAWVTASFEDLRKGPGQFAQKSWPFQLSVEA